MTHRGKLKGRRLAILGASCNRRALARRSILVVVLFVAALLIAIIAVPLAMIGPSGSALNFPGLGYLAAPFKNIARDLQRYRDKPLTDMRKADCEAVRSQLDGLKDIWRSKMPKWRQDPATYDVVLHIDLDQHRMILREQGNDLKEVQFPEKYQLDLYRFSPAGVQQMPRQADFKIRRRNTRDNRCQEKFYLEAKLKENIGFHIDFSHDSFFNCGWPLWEKITMNWPSQEPSSGDPEASDESMWLGSNDDEYPILHPGPQYDMTSDIFNQGMEGSRR